MRDFEAHCFLLNEINFYPGVLRTDRRAGCFLCGGLTSVVVFGLLLFVVVRFCVLVCVGVCVCVSRALPVCQEHYQCVVVISSVHRWREALAVSGFCCSFLSL